MTPFDHVLVTGGAGFIGSQLLRRLLPLSNRVTVIDDLSTGNAAAVPASDKLTLIKASYVDEELLRGLLGDVTTIFHLACRNLALSPHHMDDDFRVNLYGGFLLLKIAKESCRNLSRFVYTSTASVYGNAAELPTPESEYQTTLPYAASKFGMEHYCQVYASMYGMPVSVLRLSNVYGPGQVTTNPYCGVIAKFMEACEQGDPLIVYGDGRQTRDYTYIDDAIAAILAAATHPAAVGRVYNVGTGVETSVNRLAELVKDVMERPELEIDYRPKRIVDVVRRRCLDARVLRRELGWEPVRSLVEGLRLTRQWKLGGGDA